MSIGLMIIGLGNHTKTKIIPTLEQLSIPIAAILSSTKIEYYNEVKVFNELEIVLKKNNITHCIISTTPSKQIIYIKKLKFLNIKTYVEKPAFVTNNDLYSVENLISKKKYLTEGLMYRFSSGFDYFLKKFNKVNKTDYEITLKFILPVPEDSFLRTFRNKKDLKNSIIYDIGTYIFDFLWVLQLTNLKVEELTIEKFNNKILKKTKFSIYSQNHNSFKKINVEIGYGNIYKNEINFVSEDQNYNINPFFWGRHGNINIINFKEKPSNKVQIVTKSALKIILYKWFNGIEDKMINDLQCFKRYNFVISELEKLERKIFNYV